MRGTGRRIRGTIGTLAWAFCAIIALNGSAAFGQEPVAKVGDGGSELARLFGGAGAPQAVRFKDLGADWKRVVIRGTGGVRFGAPDQNAMEQIMKLGALGDEGDGAEALGSLFAMTMLGGMFGGGEKDGSGATEATFYTQGKTLALGGETYLIAYGFDRPALDLMAFAMEEAAKAEAAAKPTDETGAKKPSADFDFGKLLADRKVTGESELSLALVNVKHIAAFTGVRAFQLDRELADANKGDALLEMIAKEAEKEKAQSATLSGGGEADILDLVVVEIRNEFEEDPELRRPDHAIAVERRKDVIVLRGTVPNAKSQARAANIARRVLADTGEKARVVNQIDVRNQTQTRPL